MFEVRIDDDKLIYKDVSHEFDREVKRDRKLSSRKKKEKHKKKKELPNKYFIMKSLKPDYLVLVSDKKNKMGLTSYGVDKILFEYLKGNDNLRVNLYNKLNKLEINYLILDGIEETYVHSFENNHYGDILYTAIFEYLI